MIDDEYFYKLYNKTTNKWLMSKDYCVDNQRWGKHFASQKRAAQYLYRVARQVQRGRWHKPNADINSVFNDDWVVVAFKAETFDTKACTDLLDKKKVKTIVKKAIKENRVNPTSIAAMKQKGLL